ncbi:hypothetical protein BDZ91DRAFT_725055 [Kalaharituber pfeilii]|nr:hypothetical protein BDZ91DRAFT_725055 [Kalaharituber pfeilii]
MTMTVPQVAENGKKRLFCLSICGYRKLGLSEEQYHDYLTNVHGPLIKGLMEKYGIVSYSIVSLFFLVPSPCSGVTITHSVTGFIFFEC